jgi:crotonobetainyl-CoA:carnitine CoA-transferase CaiB-like acyl-CoA transferase
MDHSAYGWTKSSPPVPRSFDRQRRSPFGVACRPGHIAQPLPSGRKDARFASNAARVRNRKACVRRVKELTREHPTAFWLENLSRLSIPCGPVNTIDKTFADPHVEARGMVVELEHGASGRPEKYIASPIRMSATPVEYRRAAPMIGEHTEEVLGELLGMDKAAVAKLRASGAV